MNSKIGLLTESLVPPWLLEKPTYLGKVVAQKLKLKVGDHFKAILPKVSGSSATRISPHWEDFYVHSILDFGKYEFNERMILTEIKNVQKLAEMGEKNQWVSESGFMIQIQAIREAGKIQEVLGWSYVVRDWSMDQTALCFKAIRYEKGVLFFVMLIMVVAAFFNVSTILFLGVLRRYPQISVIRTLGLRRRDIVMLFCFHGLVFGVLGLLFWFGPGAFLLLWF